MDLSTLLVLGVVCALMAVAAAILWARARQDAMQPDRVAVMPSAQGANAACVTAVTNLSPAPYEPPSTPTEVIDTSHHNDVAAKTSAVLQRVALDLPDDAGETTPCTLGTTDDEIDTTTEGVAAADFCAPDEGAAVPSEHVEEAADCSPMADDDFERDTDVDESCKVGDVDFLVGTPERDAEPSDVVGVNATLAEDSSLVESASAPAEAASKKKQTSVYRDQRGKRRSKTPPTTSASPPPSVSRAPAEARLRLTLNAIQKAATLTIVLSRHEGYPESITPLAEDHGPIDAYDDGRYDDLDTQWTSDLLTGEIRIQSAEGFQWLRTSRRIHIFVSDPSEAGLIVTGSARAGITHAIICRQEDTSSVVSYCEQTGSSPPVQLDRWSGIPDGWCILTNFKPVHAPTAAFPTTLQTLDPGTGTEITLRGGLAIRSHVYAEGRPPQISISALPAAATVAIDGADAIQNGEVWTASGWDRPGQHMIDVVPGPSLSYEIAPDPARAEGWDHLNAHADRFSSSSNLPWSNAAICGAVAASNSGACLYAIEPHTGAVAIGAQDATALLVQRLDAPVSAGFVPFSPAFIICMSGMRRAQGRVVWLGVRDEQARRRKADLHWVAIVRSATARHLRLDTIDPAGVAAWQSAKKRARRQKRSTR